MLRVFFRFLYMKIPLCVGIADVFNNGAQCGFVMGVFPVFDPTADQITEDAAEVFMPGVAEKAAGIGKHTDEAREISIGGQRRELVDHAALVVIEPPGAAVLHL